MYKGKRKKHRLSHLAVNQNVYTITDSELRSFLLLILTWIWDALKITTCPPVKCCCHSDLSHWSPSVEKLKDLSVSWHHHPCLIISFSFKTLADWLVFKDITSNLCCNTSRGFRGDFREVLCGHGLHTWHSVIISLPKMFPLESVASQMRLKTPNLWQTLTIKMRAAFWSKMSSPCMIFPFVIWIMNTNNRQPLIEALHPFISNTWLRLPTETKGHVIICTSAVCIFPVIKKKRRHVWLAPHPYVCIIYLCWGGQSFVSTICLQLLKQRNISRFWKRHEPATPVSHIVTCCSPIHPTYCFRWRSSLFCVAK